MSAATWGDHEPQSDEKYPISLIRHLLQQMMKQFAAHGAVIALFDESLDQMVVRMHMRQRNPNFVVTPLRQEANNFSLSSRRTTIELSDSSSSAIERQKYSRPTLEDIEVVSAYTNELFSIGTAYPSWQDLIGYTWGKKEPLIMRHEEYLASFHPHRNIPLLIDIPPRWYLSVPILEPMLSEEVRDKKREPRVLGVVVLYSIAPGQGPAFQQRQRYEALNFSERIALYLQNDTLRRLQERSGDYMRGLQKISTAFPNAVKLSDLVEDIYAFVTSVVDASSMLLTLYDRDTNKIYDVFAVNQGKRVEGLTAQPLIYSKEDRPVWWRFTQEEQRSVLLAPNNIEQESPDASNDDYDELLKGSWGDQSKAESFLLLPMKMFTRVIGSLCISSTRPHAYTPEETVVLETMVQIITVSIENARLYDRSHHALREAGQRAESLAAMNSALQAISAVLNVTELLHKFVETVAKLVQAEMCTFFQLSLDGKELIAQAIYDTTRQWQDATSNTNIDKHNDLIEMIRLPFQGSILEQQVEAETFFYLDSVQAEELAQASGEGGAIFLRETHIQKMLMIPVRYQTEIVGILAVHTPRINRVFRPKEVGTLLAICAQAASAIRNAQLFEQIQEANAELRRMDKLKDEFIVTASHELRTPLSAISGYASLLKRQGGRITSEQILRFASKIAGSAQQLSDLVANMTEAAKMGALDKKLDLQIGPVQVRAVAEVAISMLSVNIEQKITSHIAPELWVNADALHLRQVMTNLLDNAAKYSAPEGRIILIATASALSQLPLPEDQIDTEALVAGKDLPVVQVRICDEGEGIAPEDQHKIFEKFVRASRSLTTPIRGSGLGLYICRRYIEAMGGKLWLEKSIPAAGSVFSFYLPRIPAPIQTNEQDEDEPEYESTHGISGG